MKKELLTCLNPSASSSGRFVLGIRLALLLCQISVTGCTWLQRDEDSSQAELQSGAPEQEDGKSAGAVGSGSLDITPESVMKGDQKEELEKDDGANRKK